MLLIFGSDATLKKNICTKIYHATTSPFCRVVRKMSSWRKKINRVSISISLGGHLYLKLLPYYTFTIIYSISNLKTVETFEKAKIAPQSR